MSQLESSILWPSASVGNRAAPVRRRGVDGWLLAAVLLLCLSGIVMVYSSSAILAQNENRPDTAYLRSQIEKVTLGIVAMLALAHLPYRRLAGRAAGVALGLAVVLLLALLLPLGLAVVVRGTRRFLDLGLMQVQPAEFARIALVLFLADYACRKGEWMETNWKGLIVPFGAIGVIILLILRQPNLSSAALIGFLGAGMLFLSGQHWKRLLIPGLIMLPVVAINVKLYQYARVSSFARLLGGGTGSLEYQVKQSLVALGSGGLLGQGIGQGLQKYLYLPFPHTDFILGIVGEETGFLGVLILFTLYGIVLVRGLRIARLAPDRFARLTASGLTLSIALNFVLHSAVALGLGPVTGVPLPFVSHGGSSLLANLMAVGILLSISRHLRTDRRKTTQAWRVPRALSRHE